MAKSSKAYKQMIGSDKQINEISVSTTQLQNSLREAILNGIDNIFCCMIKVSPSYA